MQIFPLTQTVILHGKSKHPIIIIDAHNVAWVVNLPIPQKLTLEIDLLEDSIHDEILQALASKTYQPIGNWIIRTDYVIRYYTPSKMTFEEEATRVLGYNILNHQSLPADKAGNLFITSPATMLEVHHHHTDKEKISKLMQLAMGNEIDFISDSMSVTTHLLFDTLHQKETTSGNPYRVIEQSFEEDIIGALLPLPDRITRMRYLLDSADKTQVMLSDITDTNQPPVGSAGYLDFEMALYQTEKNIWRPRVRRQILWNSDGFMDYMDWRDKLTEEEREEARTKHPVRYTISLDCNIGTGVSVSILHNKPSAYPNYPGLYMVVYKHSPDTDSRPRHSTALELFEEMPLHGVLGMEEFTGTTIEEAETHLIKYIEEKHPDIMDNLRFYGLIDKIKSII